jgi:hypothetical protein
MKEYKIKKMLRKAASKLKFFYQLRSLFISKVKFYQENDLVSETKLAKYVSELGEEKDKNNHIILKFNVELDNIVNEYEILKLSEKLSSKILT